MALLVLVVASAATAHRLPAQQLEDVVYLKDGSIIHGTIIEQRPGESILIRTKDGNQFRYQMSQIEKMTKEPIPGTAAAPAAGGGPRPVVGRKNPGVAFLLSFLITGAGQGYNGQWGKAAAMFGGVVVSYVVALGGVDACVYDDECGQFGAGLIGIVGFTIWSWVDAPISASAINMRLSRGASLEVGPRLHLGMGQPTPALGYRFAPAFGQPRPQPFSLSLVRVRF